MNRKIPTKPFSSNSDKKVSPEQAKRNEPNVSSNLSSTPSQSDTPYKKASKSKGFGSSLLLLLLLFTALGAYLGYTLGNEFLDNSEPSRVEFSQTEYTYEVGDAGRLPVLVKGEFSSYDLFWISSNAEIVEVDQGGNIVALAPGRVIITAAVGNGAIKDTVIVNVVEPAE